MNTDEQTLVTQLFAYWSRLPVLTELDLEQTQILDQEIRAAINDILAIGLDALDPTSKELKRRRALSAKEILDELNKRDLDVKKSNLYFHLDKMEEAGLIRTVLSVPLGKKSTSYYGRTSRAFLPYNKGDLHQKFTKETFEKIAQLIQRINPDSNVSEKDMVNKIERNVAEVIGPVNTSILVPWIEKYQDEFLELDIDTRELINFLTMLSSYSEKVFAMMHDIKNLLDFNTE